MDEHYLVPLTSAEALATLALLRAAASILPPDAPAEPALFQSAFDRIAAQLPEFVGDRAHVLARALEAALAPNPRVTFNDQDNENDEQTEPPFATRRTRRLLEDAWERNAPVEIEYYVASRREWTLRRVAISDVYERQHTWYVSGQCEMRGEFRQFRLDHVRSVRVLDDREEHDPFADE